MLVACSQALRQPGTPTRLPASPTFTLQPPTATATTTETSTLVPPTVTQAPTSAPSETPLPSQTLTPTLPPSTPSGDQAVFVYMIKTGTDGPIGCGDTAIPINTGIWRTGDVEQDVVTALRNLFVKRQYIAGLYNPAYLSNIQVDSVVYKAASNTVEVMLSGTYVRSGDRCDDRRVRAQVWSTIRQFPGVKVVYILLNGNLLGDILANG